MIEWIKVILTIAAIIGILYILIIILDKVGLGIGTPMTKVILWVAAILLVLYQITGHSVLFWR